MTTNNKRKKKRAAQIRQVESKIADVDREALEAEGDLQTHYREALVKLREVKNLADVQFEQLHETGDEAWDDLRDEVDRAIERVRTNLEALMARIHDETTGEPPVRRKNSRTKTDNA